MTANYDWTKFKKQIFIYASPETVFDAWSKPGELTRWFIAQAEYTAPDGETRSPDESIQAGDQYYWRWHQGNEIQGEFLKVESRHTLQFTFGDKQAGSDEKIIVSVEITEVEPGTTLLELTQDNIADTLEAHHGWHLSCNLGWSFFMTNLKALLEHGVDLREYSQERAADARAISHSPSMVA